MAIQWLIERMIQWKDRPALIWRDREYSYGNVLHRYETWMDVLNERKISIGSLVALEGDYSPNACALLLALIKNKAVVIPLTKAMESHRREFLEIAEAEHIIGFDEVDEPFYDKTISTVENPLVLELRESEQPGLVLFSSGSTGKSKASLHNFTKLLEKFKVLRHRMRSINFLLFDHIGGINTLFYTLSNGGTVIVAEDRNPDSVCSLIEKHKAELLPTTPTFLNLLLISEAYKRYDLSSLKMITYGTEVMPESVLLRIHNIFPHVELRQTYGLSELGILRAKSMNADSLWIKIGGEAFQTKIVDNILWIRADCAMLGYLNAPSPFTEDGWFVTDDEVEVNGEYIRILGRRSEVINMGGEKVYPAEVESAIQAMEGVEDVVIRGEPNPITGQIVAAQVKLNRPESLTEFRKRMHDFCRVRLPAYKIPQKVNILSETLYSERYKKKRRMDGTEQLTGTGAESTQ